jgi:ribosomal protein L35
MLVQGVTADVSRRRQESRHSFLEKPASRERGLEKKRVVAGKDKAKMTEIETTLLTPAPQRHLT